MGFLAAGLAAFLAAGFLAAGLAAFLAAGFLAAFLAAGFLAAAFLATGFLAAGFLAALGLGSSLASLKDPEAPVPLTCFRAPAATPFFRARRRLTAAFFSSAIL